MTSKRLRYSFYSCSYFEGGGEAVHRVVLGLARLWDLNITMVF